MASFVMRSSHLLFITLFIVGLQLSSCFNSENYENHVQLSDVYNVYWTIEKNTTEGDYINLALSVKTLGWIGFGIAEPTSGSMPGSDILVAYVVDGTAHIEDRYATAFSTPSKDLCNDWTLVSGSEKDNITTIEVRRKLVSADTAQDREIKSGVNRIIYAWGTSDTFTYHGANRYTQALTFFGGKNATTLTDVTSVTLLNSVTLPAKQTSYMCTAHPVSYFASTMNDYHIVQFRAILNTSYVHHFVVHACNNGSWSNYVNKTSDCVSPLVDVTAECQVAWVWTPGMDTWTLPSNVGYRFGPSTDISYFVIETHYSNFNLTVNATDHSGLELTFTKTLRQHDLGIMTLGDPGVTAPAIPGNKSEVFYEFSCPSQCTSRWGKNITIIASLEHMHMTGKRMWTSMWRNNSNTDYLGELERVDYYNFDYQTWNEVDHVVMPGDRFNVHCVYDTSDRVNATRFGGSSYNEMCMNFIAYYPQIPYKMCGYAYWKDYYGENNVTVCGSLTDGIQITNPVNTDPIKYNARTFGVNNTNGCGTETSTGESETTSDSKEESEGDSLGEVTGAGGIVALIAIISGIAILLAWYVQKRKKEEKARLAALEPDVEVPVVKRNEQGVIKLEESGYYEDEK